ncbi:GTPase ObgE [Microgenomates group bacterium]|nr:GTPase ObgE [Microgenomates group bacterium]
MVDLVQLKLSAGNGGNGKVSFLRSRGITKGGPNGGNGGRGGDIILRASEKINTLRSFSGMREIKAQNGEKGGKFHREGKAGEETIVEVPVGTVVWLIEENKAGQERRMLTGLKRKLIRREIKFKQYSLERAAENPQEREKDDIVWKQRDIKELTEQKSADAIYEELGTEKLLKIAQFSEDGQEVVICQGGWGGRGNDAFKSASHQTPLEAEYGTWGEQRVVFLEVKMLADVGLVGYPNAGKSSLLSRLTKARPKIANYPFTTLEPHLGVMDRGREREGLVMADIPGLIEGASEGKGLGRDFLRHIENCRELWVVVALDEAEVSGVSKVEEKVNKIEIQVEQLRKELAMYSDILLNKEWRIIVNKSDLYDEKLKKEIRKRWPKAVLISCATGEGLEQLR